MKTFQNNLIKLQCNHSVSLNPTLFLEFSLSPQFHTFHFNNICDVMDMSLGKLPEIVKARGA